MGFDVSTTLTQARAKQALRMDILTAAQLLHRPLKDGEHLRNLVQVFRQNYNTDALPLKLRAAMDKVG